MLAAHIDFETRSTTDLKKAGLHRYVEDPNTGAWLFSWRIGFGQVHRWHPGQPDPLELLAHIAKGGKVTAHNAAFERWVWNVTLIQNTRGCELWPELTIEQQDCTLARAAAMGLPQGLGELCDVLQTSNRKDGFGGYQLMMKMCRPRSATAVKITWWDEYENLSKLGNYCDTDVLTECDVDTLLPPLTDYERKVWEFDQRINDRGVPIDVNAVTKCADLTTYAKKEADRLMRVLTMRKVPKVTNDKKIIEFLKERGIDTNTVRKDEQEDLLIVADYNNDPIVRQVIELRRGASKTSTAKYAKILGCVCMDGRIRGLLQYYGAGTGRWAGRLVQPQNFPRVDSKKEEEMIKNIHTLLADPKLSIPDIYELISLCYEEAKVLDILKKLLRSMIVAPEGYKLVGGDFANIEGRFNAWFANETWKLQAFRDYDAGIGQDLYKLAYAKSFGVSVESIEDLQRQIGKVQELALGYQGGVGAYIDMGATYGVDPYALSGPVYAATRSDQWDYTAKNYESATDKNELPEREWTALKILVDNYRAANPAIVNSWWDYQDTAIAAVSSPMAIHHCANGKVSYYCDGAYLWCLLPSGRMLCYNSPSIRVSEMEYVDKNTGQKKTREKKSVAFYGRDSKTKQWRETYLYGGLQCNNNIQGTARDLMVDRMLHVEERNYPIILTVHDEILSLPEDRDEFNAKEFEQLMSVLPYWAEGLPLAAKAWEDRRYTK